MLSEAIKRSEKRLARRTMVKAYENTCPIRDVLDRIGDKWSVLIILNLSERGALRFSDLQKNIPGISKKMLSKSLQSLERDGLLEREVEEAYPPKVSYELSDLGLSLQKPIGVLTEWAIENRSRIEKERHQFDEGMLKQDRVPWQKQKPSRK